MTESENKNVGKKKRCPREALRLGPGHDVKIEDGGFLRSVKGGKDLGYPGNLEDWKPGREK